MPVQNLFDYLEEGDSLDVFLKQFPSVTRELAIGVLEKARVSLVAVCKTLHHCYLSSQSF